VSFLGSAWSLSTEWQFYVLALLVAGSSRRLCGVLLGLAAAGIVWRLSVPDAWQFSRAFLPNKGHFFALGVASVAVVRGESGALRGYGIVLAAVLAMCATLESFGKMLPPLAWTLCLLVQMRPRTPGIGWAGRLLRSSAARYLGAISYCVYLVNEPIHKITGALLSRLVNSDALVFTVLWVPLAIGLPLLAAAGLHRYLEAPAMHWGRVAARRRGVPRLGVEAVPQPID
jgi:peptidoglycan/LPS O-acetylase OafA/YrhL